MSDVKRLARWNGWCDSCATERPLVLTETGERGLRAWLRGIGPEDRSLTLTCIICGVWQSVPYDEADAPAEVAAAPAVALHPLGLLQVVVRPATASVPAVPAPRQPAAPVNLPPVHPFVAARTADRTADRTTTNRTSTETTLALVANDLDLIALAG